MKIIKYLSAKQRLFCILIILIAIIGAAAASYWPVLLSDVYNRIVEGDITDAQSGFLPFILFGVAFAGAEVSSIIRRVWTDIVSASFEMRLRNKSIKKLLRLPTSFFNSNTSGEYTAKINQSVAGANQLVKVICNNIVPSIFISGFTIYQIMRKAPSFFVAILVSYIVLEIGVSILQIKSQNGIREKLIAKKAKLDGTICQSIQNIEMIRVTNSEEYEFNRISPHTNDIREVECRHHTFMGTFDAIKQLLKVMYTVILLFVSIGLVSYGSINGGTVITIILLFQQLVAPIDAVHVFMDEFASSSIKAKELTKLLSAQEDEIYDTHLIDSSFPDGDIHIKDLTIYTPDKAKTICQNQNFVLDHGKTIALKGPTGCGKSSIVKGIMRFYPSNGEVLIGGQSIKRLSQQSICDGIYDLIQQPVFFSGSLKENLLYGLNDSVSEDRMLWALKEAGIYEELREKSESVFTLPVSEGGSNYSGGQRQRIALAKAFLRKPKWFFVDEATANIDDTTTSVVFDNLKKYAKSIGAGILCISHQQVVIEKCDKTITIASPAVA